MASWEDTALVSVVALVPFTGGVVFGSLVNGNAVADASGAFVALVGACVVSIGACALALTLVQVMVSNVLRLLLEQILGFPLAIELWRLVVGEYRVRRSKPKALAAVRIAVRQAIRSYEVRVYRRDPARPALEALISLEDRAAELAPEQYEVEKNAAIVAAKISLRMET